jgi:hypothetical protein
MEYFGMCSYGAVGLIATLAHLDRIAPGAHRIGAFISITEDDCDPFRAEVRS